MVLQAFKRNESTKSYKEKCRRYIEIFIPASHKPYRMIMAEVEGRDDLSEELPGLFGGEPAFLHQVVKQLSARHMLQHQVPGRQIKIIKKQKINGKKKNTHSSLYLPCILVNYLKIWRKCLVSRKEPDSKILTGICYFHRHHAASEHEGALLVLE